MNKKTSQPLEAEPDLIGLTCPECGQPLTLTPKADQPERIVGTCTCTPQFNGAPRAMIEFDAPQGAIGKLTITPED